MHPPDQKDVVKDGLLNDLETLKKTTTTLEGALTELGEKLDPILIPLAEEEVPLPTAPRSEVSALRDTVARLEERIENLVRQVTSFQSRAEL